jgi:hypothetical protein
MDGAGYRSTPYDGGAGWAADVAARNAASKVSPWSDTDLGIYDPSSTQLARALVGPMYTAQAAPPAQTLYPARPRLDDSGSQVLNASGQPVYDRVLPLAPVQPGVFDYSVGFQTSSQTYVESWYDRPKGSFAVDDAGNVYLPKLTMKDLGANPESAGFGTQMLASMNQGLASMRQSAQDGAFDRGSAALYVGAAFIPSSVLEAGSYLVGGPVGRVVGKGIGAIALKEAAPLFTEAQVAAAAKAAQRARIEANIANSQAGRASSNFGQFIKNEGQVQANLGIWPPNGGAYAPTYGKTLSVGTQLDRFGYPGGKYVSPLGESFGSRALPPSYLDTKPYFQYEVVKPIPGVTDAKVLPWFGQPGMGTQFQLPNSVQHYLENGFLKVIQQ